MMLMNSFYLYNQNTIGPKLSLYDYRMSILSELLPKKSKSKTSLPSKITHVPETHEIGKNGRANRKRRQLCYLAKIRLYTSKYFCYSCPKQSSLCLEPCFKKFHNSNQL